MKKDFKFSQRTRRVSRESVVVMKLLQERTKHGMIGSPTGDTFVLVSMSRFLDDEAYCSMVTRNSFLPEVLNNMRRAVGNHVPQPWVNSQVLKNMRKTMEISCFSHGRLIKTRSIQERVRITPRAVASLLV